MRLINILALASAIFSVVAAQGVNGPPAGYWPEDTSPATAAPFTTTKDPQSSSPTLNPIMAPPIGVTETTTAKAGAAVPTHNRRCCTANPAAPAPAPAPAATVEAPACSRLQHSSRRPATPSTPQQSAPAVVTTLHPIPEPAPNAPSAPAPQPPAPGPAPQAPRTRTKRLCPCKRPPPSSPAPSPSSGSSPANAPVNTQPLFSPPPHQQPPTAPSGEASYPTRYKCRIKKKPNQVMEPYLAVPTPSPIPVAAPSSSPIPVAAPSPAAAPPVSNPGSAPAQVNVPQTQQSSSPISLKLTSRPPQTGDEVEELAKPAGVAASPTKTVGNFVYIPTYN
ncbi:hypothetical protein BC829DRAFT_443199 [Chytridium lagenaria]|nr:hypothetical protein BC829DRAFT_443199 [Chytridium lagenaria]